MSSGRCRPGSGGTGGWPRGPRWGEAGEVLPHEGAGGQHRFAAQHGATTLAADEGGREPGDGFVPQVAEVLERLTVEPRGALARQRFRPPHSAAPTPRPTPRNPCGASASICPVTLACSTPRPQRPPSPHRIKPPPNPGRLTSAERLQPKPAPSAVTTTDQTERSHPGRPKHLAGFLGSSSAAVQRHRTTNPGESAWWRSSCWTAPRASPSCLRPTSAQREQGGRPGGREPTGRANGS